MQKPKIIFYKKIKDSRGYFSEIFKIKLFKNKFVQDNLVLNKKKNVFRGLHYQVKPFAQGKLITVLKGAIIDYVCNVDIDSKNYKKIKKFYLSEKDNKWLWVPANFAHGYLTKEYNTVVLYKVTNYYSPKFERNLNIFKDKFYIKLGINKSRILTSKKDR
jgi:dTDP-4-dehydrorhamnose 3,5-epimerase